MRSWSRPCTAHVFRGRTGIAPPRPFFCASRAAACGLSFSRALCHRRRRRSKLFSVFAAGFTTTPATTDTEPDDASFSFSGLSQMISVRSVGEGDGNSAPSSFSPPVVLANSRCVASIGSSSHSSSFVVPFVLLKLPDPL